MMKPITPICIAALIVGACTSKNLTSAVDSFDSSVTKAVKTYNTQLDTVVTQHEAEVRDRLASERAVLVPALACDDLLLGYTPERVAACTVERVENGERRQVDANPVRVAQLKALANSLAGYSSSLRQLYADASADKKAFGKAVNGLADAVGGLQGEVERASGKTGVSQNALGAVASLVADVGTLYFEHRRSRVLRNLIREAHPVVVAATEILEESSAAAQRTLLARNAHAELDSAKNDLRHLLGGNPSQSKVRSAQDKLFKAHAEYLAAISATSPFGQIRQAHAAMVAAAEAGLSTAEMIALTEQLVKLAGRVETQVTTLEEELK